MKKLLYLLSWFVVFVPAVVFADSDIKSGLPPTIPNYNWETSFETINSENNLVLLTTMPKSPYLNIEGSVTTYWAKNAGIYSADSDYATIILKDDKYLNPPK